LDSFNGAIKRWTRLVLRTRWLVLGFWVVVLIAGGLASTGLGVLLSNGFGVPGSDSAQAQAVLARQFESG
jgi:putative drug exporter of the RND superfamily